MMYGGYGMGSGFGFLGPLFMLVFWGLIIAGIVLVVRGLSGGTCCGLGHGHRHGHGLSSDEKLLDVLKTRYANGEIDKKEFEEKKKVLFGTAYEAADPKAKNAKKEEADEA